MYVHIYQGCLAYYIDPVYFYRKDIDKWIKGTLGITG